MTQYLPGKLLVRHVTLSSAIPFPQVCIPANSYSGQAGKSTHVCLGWLLQGTIVDMLEDVIRQVRQSPGTESLVSSKLATKDAC